MAGANPPQSVPTGSRLRVIVVTIPLYWHQRAAAEIDWRPLILPFEK
jgi:hypothetical protein